MRILPITLNRSIPQNQTNYRNHIQRTNYITKPLAADTVSFGRSALNGETLRKLIKYGLPDMYTGQFLLDGEKLEGWMKNEVYSRSISGIVQKLAPYKNVLHKSELQVFNMIEKLSKKKPNETLDNAVKRLSLRVRPELSEIQGPIFNDLIEQSKKLPQENKKAFDKLINNTILQLNNEPISIDFNIKDFRYKLSRISLGISQRGVEEEVNAIKKLMDISKKSTINKKGTKLSHIIKSNTGKGIEDSHSKYEIMISNIENYFSKSVLKDDKELKDLISTAKDLIDKKPTIINFSRKNFIHNLEKVVETLEDKKFAHSLIKTARKLPTSHETAAAFLVKESGSSSKKIFYDLLSGSVATLDHLLPFSKGGKDTLSNYGATSQYTNSGIKKDRSFENMLKEYPETSKNCQKYVDRLIQLYNRGVFNTIGLKRAYITDFAQTVFKLSPKEKPLVLDLSKLNP